MQALDEGRRRAHQELKTSERLAADHQQNLEVRSHVLTLREGELDSRLRDRDRTIQDLNLRLRELTGLLRKEQATRELLSQQIAELQSGGTPKRPARKSKKSKSKKGPKLKSKRRKSARVGRKRRT